MRFLEKERECRLSSLLFPDDLDLCGESEEDLRAMVGSFVEVCTRCLKANAGKSKVMLLNGEERLEYKVYVGGILLEHLNILDDSSTYGVEYCRQVASGGRVEGP